MRSGLLAIALGGCHLVFPLSNDGDTLPPNCYGDPASFVRVCVRTVPENVPQLPTAIDTTAGCDDVDDATMPPRETVCVIAGKQLTISATTTVTGTRPLILFGSESVTISAALDAAGHNANPNGPAGPAARTCAQASDPTGPTSVGGGGAGGSYGTLGGVGGSVTTASGGQPGVTSAPTQLVGGCNGGKGANPSGAAYGGSFGGHGGGAIAIVSGGTITITMAGRINASGGGGFAAHSGGGGGGGGAGGTIVLDAAVLNLEGPVFANGGGGAESGIVASSTLSSPGDESTGPGSPGAGGSQMAGNNGGAGAFQATAAVDGRSDSGTAGGGGGGGGVGVIWMYPAQSVSPNISPPSRP